jgi:serine protease Do
MVTLVLVLGCAFGCNGGWEGGTQRAVGEAAGAAERTSNMLAPRTLGFPSFAALAERAVRSVVNVSAERVIPVPKGPYPHDPFFRFFFEEDPTGSERPMQRERRERSLGSGVLVAEGVVVTNNHVVAHAKDARISFSDGENYDAEIAGRDPQSDLAVLRVKGDTTKHPALPLTEANDLRLGDPVLAVGNPFGVGHSVTMGIVSAVGRESVGIADYEDFIQTDAAINPGNSGGALVNMSGELVGINTAILSRTGGYQGIGFAIPSAMVSPIVHSLLKNGKVVRGYLGVSIQDVNEDLAKALGLTTDKGVLVSDVLEDGPADKSGLERGDVIVAFEGHHVASAARLRNLVAAKGANGKVKVDVLRGEKKKTMSVALGELQIPEPTAPAAAPAPKGELSGLEVRELDDRMRRELGIKEKIGVLIVGVEPSSAAGRAGIQPGDVVLQVGREPVKNVSDLKRKYMQTGEMVALLVRRGELTIFVPLEKSKP